jgi:hypothetical protein
VSFRLAGGGDPRRIEDYEFDAGSPVGRYWLVHGEGFTVCRADGRELGVVEHVVIDPVGPRARQLIVRRGRRRTAVATDAVTAVSPASQQFLVASRPRRVRERPRRVSRSWGRATAAAPGVQLALIQLARTAARRLEAALRIVARGLGELVVLVSVLVTAAWRRAGAAVAARRTRPRVEAHEWPGDADAPLAREAEPEESVVPDDVRTTR